MPDCVSGRVTTVVYTRGGTSSAETRGNIRTTKWSEGFPPSVFGLIGGFVIGDWYHLPRVVIIGSNIAGGLSLVKTFTSCLRLGDRLVIGLRFNRFVSPAIIKWILEPYLAERKWKVCAIELNYFSSFIF